MHTTMQLEPGLVQRLQSMLDAKSDADCLRHRRTVLRNVPTRGVRIPVIRALVTDWVTERQIDALPPDAATALAEELMRSGPTLDDKLAGMILLSERLLIRGLYSLENFPVFGQLFDDGCLDNFCVVDHFAEKILSRFLHQTPERAAQVLLEWCSSDNLWRARAGLTAFLPYAKDENLRSYIRSGCIALLQRSEDEAKTTTGSLLRAISKPDEDVPDVAGVQFVMEFLLTDSFLIQFSRSALTKATFHMDRAVKSDFRRRCTQLQLALANSTSSPP
jgi:DNA alkylation repair enzyme